MSAQEIIAELRKLNADDLRLVKAKIQEMDLNSRSKRASPEDSSLQAVRDTAKGRPWPADYAVNHGHYVSGEPRKS